MRGRRNNLVVNRRRFIQGAGAAGGAIAVGLVLPRQSWGQDAPPQVVVGQVVPFTGSAAEYGQYYRDAAALALQQINTAAEKVFGGPIVRSEEHTSELQSLMRISYAVFCLKKNTDTNAHIVCLQHA